jgi:hypothetical protein
MEPKTPTAINRNRTVMTNDMNIILVGGFNPLKNMKVSWDDEIPN